MFIKVYGLAHVPLRSCNHPERLTVSLYNGNLCKKNISLSYTALSEFFKEYAREIRFAPPSDGSGGVWAGGTALLLHRPNQM